MPELIGNIYSDSPAIKSTYADNDLMFGHTNIQEDIDRNPNWENFVPYVSMNPFGAIFGDYTMLESYKTTVHPTVGSKCPFGF